MTVEEMRDRLERMCKTMGRCRECKLVGAPIGHCYGEKASDDEIINNYKIVFGDAPTDMVNSPSHYALPGGMEVIDVEIATQGEEAVKEHCICAAVEYLLRRKKKNGDEDVRKAHWWLSKYIEILEKEAT